MWLMRGLKFTAIGMYLFPNFCIWTALTGNAGLRQNLQNPNEELSASFTKGYEQSLKKHHGIMIRPVFYVSPACYTHAYPTVPPG